MLGAVGPARRRARPLARRLPRPRGRRTHARPRLARGRPRGGALAPVRRRGTRARGRRGRPRRAPERPLPERRVRVHVHGRLHVPVPGQRAPDEHLQPRRRDGPLGIVCRRRRRQRRGDRLARRTRVEPQVLPRDRRGARAARADGPWGRPLPLPEQGATARRGASSAAPTTTAANTSKPSPRIRISASSPA